MYFQDPTLAQFQRRMEEQQVRSNLNTLFGVRQVPGDTQLRDVLDTVPGEGQGLVGQAIWWLRRRAGCAA